MRWQDRPVTTRRSQHLRRLLGGRINPPINNRRPHGEHWYPSDDGHKRSLQGPLPRQLPSRQPSHHRRWRQRPPQHHLQRRPQRSLPRHSCRPCCRRLLGRQHDPADGPHRPCRGRGRALSRTRGSRQGPAAAGHQPPPLAPPLRQRRPARFCRRRCRRGWQPLPPAPPCGCQEHPPAHALVPGALRRMRPVARGRPHSAPPP